MKKMTKIQIKDNRQE
jgi:hypothetical protein